MSTAVVHGAVRRDRWLASAAVLLVALVGAWAAWDLPVETEITHFLPSAEDRELAAISSELASSELTRTITITLEAPTPERAGAAALALAAELADEPSVAWVSAGPEEGMERAFYEAYFPHRLGLHAESATFDEAAIRTRIARLKTLLGSPTGTFVRQIATEDPWLLFLDKVDGLREGQQGALAVRDGAYVTGDDERHGVVLLASRASPFDAAASRVRRRWHSHSRNLIATHRWRSLRASLLGGVRRRARTDAAGTHRQHGGVRLRA